jgi:uncharacterized protein YbaP (TraB family)
MRRTLTAVVALCAIALSAPRSVAAQTGTEIAITVGGRTEFVPETPILREARLTQKGPALWSIRDEDSTIYLFGTVHMLDGVTDWNTAKIAEAFDRSDELWVEVAQADDPQAMAAAAAPVMQKLGLDTSTKLSARLSPSEQDALRQAADLVGAKPAELDGMKPWLAAMALSNAPLLRAGYNPSMGVDAALARAARRQNKAVRGLETPDRQVGILGGLPLTIQMQMLRTTLSKGQEGPGELQRIVAAWRVGDTNTLERGLIDDMKRNNAVFYGALIVDRNVAWVAQIRERLKGAGVTFVAVGAAHLVGPDSVQAMLARDGVEARRE